ncbi:hypothetical protein V6N12_065183 [Hibiscus sabdariffa]|uniref:Uncharacterized protein n=1 Tax=Hibiscus sabdariffa TaxID=183260 RepID=A0ABR2G8H4_9ROSI
MFAIHRQSRGVEESRFPAAIPCAGGVVMVDSGSENMRLGVSARSPRKRDTMDKGRVVDRHMQSMLHGWDSASEARVGAIQEGTMRQ